MAEPQRTLYGGGDPGNISEWWQGVLTSNEIAKIEAQQMAQIYAIAEADELNERIFSLTQQMYNNFSAQASSGVGATVEMPAELQQMIDLYAAGGQFGEGAKAEIEKGGQTALASGQLGLASTGMSSGTNAAGLGARVNADVALSKAQVEDERVKMLGGALGAAGSAKLAAGMQTQQLNAAAQNQYMATLASLKPTYVNY